jgi:ribosomal protein L11 methyltransferase
MTDHALAAILGEDGGEELWRDTDNVERLLAARSPEGTGDRLTPAFAALGLKGRTVADFGCNIGYYAFLARLMGAARVTGYDNLPRMVQAAAHFAARFGVSGVRFEVADFYAMPEAPVAEVVLAMDIVGNRKVNEGEALALYARFLAFSGEELVTTLRPVFRLGRNLELDEARAATLYPGHTRGGRLHFLECLERAHPGWRAEVLSASIPGGEFDKHMVRFARR